MTPGQVLSAGGLGVSVEHRHLKATMRGLDVNAIKMWRILQGIVKQWRDRIGVYSNGPRDYAIVPRKQGS